MCLNVDSQTGKEYLDKHEIENSKRIYQVIKRVQDILISILALVFLSPLMLIVAIIIVLDDPSSGPIFVQKRVGRNGKEFNLYKFRSMYSNAEKELDKLLIENEMDGPVFKIKDDPRITKVGKFIRKVSIDELPQFWNILKGDMSIVGPRPPLPREVKQYDDYASQRLFVTPGLSCYWQISPNRNSIPFDEWMALDIRYIKERSFITDWRIILGTFKVCLSGQGE